MPSIELGTVYLPHEHQSLKNTKTVLEAVKQRFPEWADQAQPYVNVLTFRQWLKRGSGVKKGETSIRIPIMQEIEDKNDPQARHLVRKTACLFAFPQVEKKPESDDEYVEQMRWKLFRWNSRSSTPIGSKCENWGE
jgi:hypothetical protein